MQHINKDEQVRDVILIRLMVKVVPNNHY